jgi:uncharacterized protein with von Willebrand factor type A (vWA) domain
MILTAAEIKLLQECELQVMGKNTNFLSTAVNCGYLSPEERNEIFEYSIVEWYQAKKDLAQAIMILLSEEQ